MWLWLCMTLNLFGKHTFWSQGENRQYTHREKADTIPTEIHPEPCLTNLEDPHQREVLFPKSKIAYESSTSVIVLVDWYLYPSAKEIVEFEEIALTLPPFGTKTRDIFLAILRRGGLGEETLGTLYLKIMLSRSNGYSRIPVVGARARRISCSVGR